MRKNNSLTASAAALILFSFGMTACVSGNIDDVQSETNIKPDTAQSTTHKQTVPGDTIQSGKKDEKKSASRPSLRPAPKPTLTGRPTAANPNAAVQQNSHGRVVQAPSTQQNFPHFEIRPDRDDPRLVEAKIKQSAAQALYNEALAALNAADATVEPFRVKSHNADAALANANSAVTNAKSALTAAQDRLKNANENLPEIEARAASNNVAVQKAVDDAKAALIEAQKGKAAAESQMDEAKAALADAQMKRDAAKSDLARVSAVRDQAQRELDSVKSELKRAEDARASHESALAAKNAAVSTADAKVADVQGSIDSFVPKSDSFNFKVMTPDEVKLSVEAMMAQWYTEYRKQAGMPELGYSHTIAADARGWSHQMAVNFPAKQDIDHSTQWDFERSENIAMSTFNKGTSWDRVASELMKQFQDSPLHNGNFLGEKHQSYGFGVDYYESGNKLYVFVTWQAAGAKHTPTDAFQVKDITPVTHVDMKTRVKYDASKPGSEVDITPSDAAKIQKKTDSMPLGDTLKGKFQPIPKEQDPEYQALLKKLETAKTDRDAVVAERDSLQGQSAGFNTAVSEKMSEVQTAQSKLDSENEKIKPQQQAFDAAEAKLTEAQGKIDSLNAAIEGVAAAEKAVADAEANVPVVRAAGEKAIAEAKNEVSEAAAAVPAAEEAVKTAEAAVAPAAEAAYAAKSELAEAEATLTDEKAAVADAKANLDAANAEVARLS